MLKVPSDTINSDGAGALNSVFPSTQHNRIRASPKQRGSLRSPTLSEAVINVMKVFPGALVFKAEEIAVPKKRRKGSKARRS